MAETPLSLRDDIPTRYFENETVMLDIASATYLSTNDPGSVLWRALERGTTRSALIAALLDAFEVSEERASEDVDSFLEACRRHGLLNEGETATHRDAGAS
jgi:hypothetical protein